MSNPKRCPNCGSTELVLINGETMQYKCHACVAVFQLSDDSKVSRSTHSAASPQVFFEQLMKKTVELHAYFDNEIVAGTGFFISHQYIMTNAHVIMRSSSSSSTEIDLAISIMGNDYFKSKQYIFDIVHADLNLDIAILQLQEGKSEFVSFANNIYNGEQVYAIGNSHGEGLCIVEGIVSDVSRQVDSRELFMTTALATKGNSGCPVYNTNGKLLGMITEGSKKAISMIYAIPYSVLINYIKIVEEKESIKIIES